MKNASFENLYFSFWIDREGRTAYLQEWEDGAWSEPEQFSLPVSIEDAPKKSRLARAVRSMADDALRSALEEGLERRPERESRWTRFAHALARAVALDGVTIEEPCPIPSSATPSSSNRL